MRQNKYEQKTENVSGKDIVADYKLTEQIKPPTENIKDQRKLQLD